MSQTTFKTEQQLKEGFYNYYMRLFNHYKEIYGENVAILLQNGAFYEVYGIENEEMKEGNLSEILGILNLKAGNCTHKPEASMGGFQPPYLEKYAPLLLDSGYTVIIVEQLDNKKKEDGSFARDVTKILSSSTYLDDFNISNTKKQKNKVLMTAYFEFNKKNELLMISMSSIDLSVGNSTLYSCSNYKQFDKEKCIDECYRFIHSQNPIELIIYIDNIQYIPIVQNKMKELNIDTLGTNYYIKTIPQEVTKVPYQVEFLNTIFTDRGVLDSINYLNLEKHPSIIISYLLLLRFAYEHDENIVKNVHYPKFWDDSSYLILENNAIYQLNIVKTHTISTSLIDLLDNTNTSIGKRLHKERLLNPIINPDTLSKRYNQIEWMMDKVELFEIYLKKVLDIERIHRKIENNTIDPCDFISLEKSYENIHKIMNMMNEFTNDNQDLLELFPFWNSIIYNNFNQWRADYNSIFNMNNCNSRFNDIEGKIFNDGIDSEIDSIQDKIQQYMNEVNDIQTFISTTIKPYTTQFPSKSKKKKEENDEEDEMLIKLEKNDRDGYFFTATKKRFELIEKYAEAELKKRTWIITKRDKQASNVKISFDKLTFINDNIDRLTAELKIRSKVIFNEKVKELYGKHKHIFRNIVDFIGELDWMKSAAKSAKVNFYCKPSISSKSEKSFIEAKDMRHPMIEKLLNDSHYIPNDISLGTTNNEGLLLFGTNSSGKSSLMKSLGVCIIMAQSGLYVPCSSFNYYPYKNILTRITGDDNFSKGFSSFVVEMTELRTIINRSNENSLILGDEICHGTEQVSALAIVASSIIELSNKKANFIFATHLHQLSKMDEITGLSNVHCKHLKVIYDEETDSLVYDRKLETGAGSDLYGLEVAKYIIHEQPDFIDRCMKIRRKILDVPQELVSSRTSKYNAKLIVNKCKICGNHADDVHHIDFQCSADDNGTIESQNSKFHKNVKANLVALCKKCHINVHHSIDGKKIIIDGYKQTSKGPQLLHKLVDC